MPDTYNDPLLNGNSKYYEKYYESDEDFNDEEFSQEEEILILNKRLSHERDKSKALLSAIKKIKAIMIVTAYSQLSESEVNKINEVLKPY